ncbi:hypothetical protein CP532_1168 [Ophiocordyceps camponoti-leonardi (nom. inval.)]|nr:hypothetical protein CP532_1168 [Ophiocordyceps camponoti-leonardi (nom. inval.)]
MAQFLIIPLLAFLYYFYRRLSHKRTGPNLPPGPKSWPIIGSITALPPKGVPEFEHWLKHKDLYGPISSVTVMGYTLIILHDLEAAQHLLEKCSAKTSARPEAGCVQKLCGFEKFMPFMQYDEACRLSRKMMNHQLGSKVLAAQYDDIQEVETRRSLLRILEKPEDLIQHLKTHTSAINLKMTYGYSIEVHDDPLVDMSVRMMTNMMAAFTPLAWLVDLIPALEHLPEGLPGTGFRKTARRWGGITRQVVDTPYRFVQRQMESHRHRPSYVSRILESGDGSGNDEHLLKESAAIIHGAVIETSSAALTTFISAMVMFPEAQRRAQEEIDRLIGTDRLPRLEDRARLPYVEALVKEVHRWSPAVPLSAPHVAEGDIVYRGYLIPKGAYIFPSVWWFLNDPGRFTDPRSFQPERFLEPSDDNETKPDDPIKMVFGFGRRICPGRFFADSTMFITVAQILAAFSIGKAKDEQGQEIEIKLESTTGPSNHPKEFPYSIVPRSARHEELVRAVETDYPWEESDAAHLVWESS